MIRFIEQEAAEKAEEIIEKAKAELNGVKTHTINQRVQELKADFKKRAEDIKVDKEIKKSRRYGEIKIATMQSRDSLMTQVKGETLASLNDVHKSPQYGELLIHLIVEGLIRMQEKNVTVKFREMDKELAELAIPQAKKTFEEVFQKNTGMPITITLKASSEFLPGPASEGKLGCAGGVVLSANGGKMLLRNTLDSRLDIAFTALAPQLRGLLFGVRPDPVSMVQDSH